VQEEEDVVVNRDGFLLLSDANALFPQQARVAWEEADDKGGWLVAAGLKCDAYLRPAGQPEKPKAGTKRKEHDGKLGDEDDCVVVDDALRAPAGPQGQEQVGRQE
jgi:hypothetical protein